MKASLVILACIVVVAVLGEEQVVPTTETFQHGGYIFKFNVEKKVLVDTPLYQQGVASVNVQVLHQIHTADNMLTKNTG